MESSLQRPYWPTMDWKELSPHEVKMNPAVLSQIETHVNEQLPGLRSLLIARHGYLVFERYYQGATRDDDYYIASVTKSVISALVGISLQQGTLLHLDQTLAEVFPASLLAEVELNKKEITLRSLLTNTSGLAREGQYTLTFDEHKNFVSSVLELPLQEQSFHYNNNGPHILLYLLTCVNHMGILDFAKMHLFEPLGISTNEQWRITAQGWYPGPVPVGRLLLKPRDMLKFGYLYLNGGFWEGRQIIPAAYVVDSTHQHSEGGWPIGTPYGYFWWITHYGQYNAFFASGIGGQRIWVIPILDIVIVATASIMQDDPEQEKKIHELVSRFVLPAIIDTL